MSANERQIGGTHYKAAGQEEHWDRVARLGLDYFQGQITKYVERWKLKGGVEDLKKARHFLDKYLEVIEAGLIPNVLMKYRAVPKFGPRDSDDPIDNREYARDPK